MDALSRIQELQRILDSSNDNTALSELLILRSRIEGEHVYLEALSDRLTWNRYPKTVQDHVIDVVGSRLGDTFRHIESQSYECAGLSHRIATFRHRSSGALLNLIPGGTYQMGSNSEEEHEGPAHEVTIEAFLIGKYPIHQNAWDEIGGDDRRRWRGRDLPIESCSWEETTNWLRKAGSGLRLPSESEWEYACRAGSTARYFWTTHDSEEAMDFSYCWAEDNSDGRTHRVTQHSEKSNAFGLVDMLGQVWEWCQDQWIADYRDGPIDHLPRTTTHGSIRVARGGAWFYPDCYASLRNKYWAGGSFSALGFRLAKSLNALEQPNEQ